jgi:hypothetical protein
MVRKFKIRLASVDGGGGRVPAALLDRIACARRVQMLNPVRTEGRPDA